MSHSIAILIIPVPTSNLLTFPLMMFPAFDKKKQSYKHLRAFEAYTNKLQQDTAQNQSHY
jgi:hypothetical protein